MKTRPNLPNKVYERACEMDAIAINTLTWIRILFFVTQSAMFSGLNLAFFSVSRLRLEVEVATGNRKAAKVLRMRENSNFLLIPLRPSEVEDYTPPLKKIVRTNLSVLIQFRFFLA